MDQRPHTDSTDNTPGIITNQGDFFFDFRRETIESRIGLQRADLSKTTSSRLEEQGILGKLTIDTGGTALSKNEFAGTKKPEARKDETDETESPDFRGKHGPPSIRHNNPGAMYPGESSSKFGSTVTHIIGGGHKIAEFPDAISGAAAQFDLLSSNAYRNKPVGAAIAKWCGHNSESSYRHSLRNAGIDLKETVAEVMDDKEKAIHLAKTMARVEAGKDFPLSKEQWDEAYNRYKKNETTEQPSNILKNRGEQPRDPQQNDRERHDHRQDRGERHHHQRHLHENDTYQIHRHGHQRGHHHQHHGHERQHNYHHSHKHRYHYR